VYSSPGTYTVTVRVTDDDRAVGSDSFQVGVAPNDGPQVENAIDDLTVHVRLAIRKGYANLNAVFQDADDADGTLQFSIVSDAPSLVMPELEDTGQVNLVFVSGRSGTARIVVRGTDPSGLTADESFVVTVIPSSWQNDDNPFDVNDDGTVGPSDVLQLINEINRTGARKLPAISGSGEMPANFWDVNGDGFLTPRDPLAVIKHINATAVAASAGEGEQAQVAEPGVMSVDDDWMPWEAAISDIAEDVADRWQWHGGTRGLLDLLAADRETQRSEKAASCTRRFG
jgi:hypothetical protein